MTIARMHRRRSQASEPQEYCFEYSSVELKQFGSNVIRDLLCPHAQHYYDFLWLAKTWNDPIPPGTPMVRFAKAHAS